MGNIIKDCPLICIEKGNSISIGGDIIANNNIGKCLVGIWLKRDGSVLIG
jgi:hypothetical protein